VANRAVALRDEVVNSKEVIQSEREQAEINLSEPVAGSR